MISIACDIEKAKAWVQESVSTEFANKQPLP